LPVDNTPRGAVTSGAWRAGGYQQDGGAMLMTRAAHQPATPLSASKATTRRATEVKRKSDRKWLWVMPMSAATSAWLIYEMANTTEAPRQAVAPLQYCLLDSVPFAPISAVVMHALRE
jgi:hypothetical protein